MSNYVANCLIIPIQLIALAPRASKASPASEALEVPPALILITNLLITCCHPLLLPKLVCLLDTHTSASEY